MIPAEAIAAACDAVSKSKGKLQFEDVVSLALEAAAPYVEREWLNEHKDKGDRR